jgi:hypothetical protein
VGEISIAGSDLKLRIVTYRNKKTGTFTSVAHPLQLLAEGDTAEEAELVLEHLVERFVQELAESGELAEFLSELREQV